MNPLVCTPSTRPSPLNEPFSVLTFHVLHKSINQPINQWINQTPTPRPISALEWEASVLFGAGVLVQKIRSGAFDTVWRESEPTSSSLLLAGGALPGQGTGPGLSTSSASVVDMNSTARAPGLSLLASYDNAATPELETTPDDALAMRDEVGSLTVKSLLHTRKFDAASVACFALVLAYGSQSPAQAACWLLQLQVTPLRTH